MAHKKGVGSTKNGRDSESKRLGVKIFGGQFAQAGNIIVRQRGTKYHPGEGVGLGKDHTIFATTDGTVAFRRRQNNRTFISVLPAGAIEADRKPVAPKAAKKAAEPVAEAETTATTTALTDAPVTEGPASVAEAPEATATPAGETDDLKKIEGIGPKIAEILTEAGLGTYAALAGASPDSIREILLAAGSHYASHNPDTWPKQAGFAAEGQWDELKAWQDELQGGRE